MDKDIIEIMSVCVLNSGIAELYGRHLCDVSNFLLGVAEIIRQNKFILGKSKYAPVRNIITSSKEISAQFSR